MLVAGLCDNDPEDEDPVVNVNGTKKEIDFDKSCHSEINLVIPSAARNLD